jgi:hypothetical protein
MSLPLTWLKSSWKSTLCSFPDKNSLKYNQHLELNFMTELTTVQLRAPYLILIGDITDITYAKTGLGIVQWRPDLVAGQLRFPGCEVEMDVPDMSVAEAVKAGGHPSRKRPGRVWTLSAACISSWRISRPWQRPPKPPVHA